MDVSGSEFTEDLFRFALLRTGCRKVAFELARRATAEAEEVSAQWRTRRHLFLWATRFVADRLEEFPPGLPEGLEFSSEFEFLPKTFSSRLRSAVALHCVGEFKLSELSQVLRLRPRELRAAIAEARKRMAQAGVSESQVCLRVREFTFSADERALLESTPFGIVERRLGVDRMLGGAAVCLGVFMLVGWVVWERWRESEPVQMRAQMERLLAVSGNLGPAGIEKFEGSAAETPDWLFLQGMEGVEVPESFAPLRLASARVLEFNGGKMAQFSVEEPQGILMVGPVDSLGLGGERSGSGRTSAGDWSGVWSVSGPYAFLLAVRATDANLEGFLKPESSRF